MFAAFAVFLSLKDLMYGEFTGDELTGILDDAFADAAGLDTAATSLTKQYGTPPAPVQVSITVPWLNPNNHSLQLPGWSTTLDLGDPDQRVQAADWYLDQSTARPTPSTPPGSASTSPTPSPARRSAPRSTAGRPTTGGCTRWARSP
ncbi:hypothetical protein GCM10010278_76260 [Streptomyces melanogenes]|nr:hypothetical protein GCM10010278_76260 [Streptomyces melanogenes]